MTRDDFEENLIELKNEGAETYSDDRHRAKFAEAETKRLIKALLAEYDRLTAAPVLLMASEPPLPFREVLAFNTEEIHLCYYDGLHSWWDGKGNAWQPLFWMESVAAD